MPKIEAFRFYFINGEIWRLSTANAMELYIKQARIESLLPLELDEKAASSLIRLLSRECSWSDLLLAGAHSVGLQPPALPTTAELFNGTAFLFDTKLVSEQGELLPLEED